jgi:signal transduction histidine kinase
MRITNKQFFNQYLAGHDGETIHSLLSQVMFLLKKKSLHIFMQLSDDNLTSEMKELKAMIQILKESFKLNRQSLTVLLRLTEESYGLRQTVELRAYK